MYYLAPTRMHFGQSFHYYFIIYLLSFVFFRNNNKINAFNTIIFFFFSSIKLLYLTLQCDLFYCNKKNFLRCVLLFSSLFLSYLSLFSILLRQVRRKCRRILRGIYFGVWRYRRGWYWTAVSSFVPGFRSAFKVRFWSNAALFTAKDRFWKKNS